MPEPLDEKKYHVMTPKMKKIAAVLALVLILVVLPVLSFAYYKIAVNRPSQNPNEVTIEIREGQGIEDITKLLRENNLVNSQFLFKFYVVINNLDSRIQAGTFVVPSGTSIAELVNVLQHGRNDTKLTILEGWRTEQIALEAVKVLDEIEYDEFVSEAEGKEGYLFPDTYYVNKDIKENELIDLLVGTFEQKTEDLLTVENLSNVQLTEQEVVTIASIVEREVNNNDDRATVAGILIRRYRDGELLGADATTQYVAAPLQAGCSLSSDKICPSEELAKTLEWWPQDLTQAQLDIESPFNTRKLAGLPPTPIASPGQEAIEAVLNPEFTSYYYYLTDLNGITHYAETLEKHNANIAQYL
jgi:UPF0755 protein